LKFYKYRLFIVCISCIITSCTPSDIIDHFELVQIPVKTNKSGQPNLTVAKDGTAYLSWLEAVDDTTYSLRFSRYKEDAWTQPKEIARSAEWFVNWADFPSIAVTPAGDLFAHWLQMSATGTYDYDIHISSSTDGGEIWSSTIIPHKDSIAAEHGFVSLIPIADHQVRAVWLDGRNTKSDQVSNNPSDHGHHGGHLGAMTLRTAIIDTYGEVTDEVELDNRVCDCCQTDIAIGAKGAIVVYRDRSEKEIRDISLIRRLGADWTLPRDLSQDDWYMPACPVNGPAIDALEHSIAVAWYSGARDTARVYVKISKDAGETFGEPIQINEHPTLGRIDVAVINEKMAAVTWIETIEEDQTFIMIRSISNNGKKGPAIPLAKTSKSRSSGFPILEKTGDNLLLTWVDISEDTHQIKTAKITY
jgi:hypothetical protein